jgi:hypothetical protein
MGKWIAGLIVSVLSAAPVGAVVVAGGDGTQNTTGDGVPGWEYVGTTRGSSAIYLGNQWVLTAIHVGVGDLTLPGRGTFTAVAGSNFRLVDPVSLVPTDLTMYRISSDPGLLPLTIATSTPTANSTVWMTGFGRNRGANMLYWSVNTSNPDNYIWTSLPNSTGANASGYEIATGNTKRWGTNVVSPFPGTSVVPGTIDAGIGPVRVFTTIFNNNVNEAQGVPNDSGGGVFDAAGRLVGMLNAIGTFPNQPANTVIFNQATYIADLSQYRNQIALRVNVIPEPSVLAGLVPVAALLARRRR